MQLRRMQRLRSWWFPPPALMLPLLVLLILVLSLQPRLPHGLHARCSSRLLKIQTPTAACWKSRRVAPLTGFRGNKHKRDYLKNHRAEKTAITSTRAFLHTGNIQSGTDNRLVRATVSASTQAPFQLFPAIKLDTRYYTKYTQAPFQLFPTSKLYTRYTLSVMHACSPPVLLPSNSSDPLRP